MTDSPQGNACGRSEPSVSAAQQAQAMRLGISFDGYQFHYREFKYDRIPDAVAYAQLEAGRGDAQAAVTNLAAWLDRPCPSEDDQKAMKRYGIRFEGNRYRYQDFYYDRLADALAYVQV